MKCKELMVNDWVANQYGTPIQIYSVGDNGAYANTGDTLWVFEDNEYKPQPIEITEDIMRKNNWKVEGYTLLPNEHYCVKDEGGNYLLLSQGTLFIWLDYGKDNNRVYDILVPCKYVHQMQQVLRIAGLTDMANNFKV